MKPDEGNPREGEPIPRELSLREIRFSKFYAELAIGSRAYELAGYPDCANPSAKAAKLLRKPRIKAYIKEIRDRAKAQADVDHGYVVLALRDIVDGKDPEVKPANKIQALGMLMKYMGMLDKKEEKAEQTEEKYVIELPPKEPVQAPAAS